MDNQSFKILIADDDPDILEFLQYNIEKEGYTVFTVSDGEAAISKAKEVIPDLIILDIMMPKKDGVETCRQLREITDLQKTFIMMLTAREEEYSEVAAFQNGANDYITKPIKPRALMSRIESIFKRNVPTLENEEIKINDLVINKTTYSIHKNGVEIKFPKKEFEVLFLLSTHPNKVFTRDELLNKIWGTEVFVVPRTVDVHIRKIREKIGEDYIKTIKGIGYSIHN